MQSSRRIQPTPLLFELENRCDRGQSGDQRKSQERQEKRGTCSYSIKHVETSRQSIQCRTTVLSGAVVSAGDGLNGKVKLSDFRRRSDLASKLFTSFLNSSRFDVNTS